MKKAITKPQKVAAMDAGRMPEMVSAQWRRAQDGLLEILKFGAMLMEVSSVIQLDNAGRGGAGWNKGMGLKNWLAEHCPDIHYQTAMGYMRAAQGLQNIAEIGADVPLLRLMDAEDTKEAEEVVGARERINKALDGASLRLLKEAGRNETDKPVPCADV